MNIKLSVFLFMLILSMFLSVPGIFAENNVSFVDDFDYYGVDDVVCDVDDFDYYGVDDVVCDVDDFDHYGVDDVVCDVGAGSGADKINISITPVRVSAPYQVGNFTFRVTDCVTGDLVVNKSLRFSVHLTGLINYDSYQDVLTDDEGIATFMLGGVNNINPNNHNLNCGVHNLTISGLGDLNGKLVTQVTVEKVDVVISPMSYCEVKGSSKKFIINVTSKLTGEGISDARLSLFIPDSVEKYYSLVCSNQGIGEVGVGNLNIGENLVRISVNDSNLNPAVVDSVVVIEKYPVNIRIWSGYYNSGKTIVLKVCDQSGVVVQGIHLNVTVDGVFYSVKTDSNGESVFRLPLGVGMHTVDVLVYSSLYSGHVNNRVNILKTVAKVKASSLKIYYMGKKQFVVKVVNSRTGDVLYNSRLHVQFKKSNKVVYNYYGRTSSEGLIKFNVKLKPGMYRVVISGGDSKNFVLNKVVKSVVVKKIPVKIYAKKSSKRLKVKVLSKVSKKVLAGVKLKISVKSSGVSKSFIKKTNFKGLVLMKLKNRFDKVSVKVISDVYSSKKLKI